MAEWSKAPDSSSGPRKRAWVQTPLLTIRSSLVPASGWRVSVRAAAGAFRFAFEDVCFLIFFRLLPVTALSEFWYSHHGSLLTHVVNRHLWWSRFWSKDAVLW
ncbi:hypothetical protein Bca4012_083138 [Brassica carinata]